MAQSPLKVSTLAWLDRRRLWATTDRKTSLGPDRLLCNPSSLGGQGTRPSVARRVFAPSYPLIFATLSIGLGAVLAITLFVYTTFIVGGLAFAKTLFLIDSALSPEKPKGPAASSLVSDQEGVGASLRLPFLSFSLVGSAGLLEGFATTPTAMPPIQGSKKWATQGPLNKQGPWALPLNKGSRNHPSFRPYLGEWRRLLEQQPLVASSKPTAPALVSKLSGGAKVLSPVAAPLYNRTSAPIKATSNHLHKPYAPYLATSWLF